MNKIFFLLVFVIFAFCSCSESETLPPSIATTPITEKTQTTAKSGGEVLDNGGNKVNGRGVCWSTSVNPTTSDYTTSDGTGLGSFTSSINDLSENTIYYYRAYATNENGTMYGEEYSFFTGKGILDQNQTTHNYGFFVHDVARWQLFTPTVKNISSIEIYISTINPKGSCTVSIQSENEVITYANFVFRASLLPKSGWIEMEIIPPIPTAVNTKYKISIVRSSPHTPQNAIVWRGATESEYPGYCSVDPDWFESYWDNYDYAFKTYGF